MPLQELLCWQVPYAKHRLLTQCRLWSTMLQINTSTVGSCAASIVIYQQGRKTVTKKVLSEVYAVLHSIGAVKNESEFSTDWLGRSECYLRTLRFKNVDASISSIAVCASKLQHYGTRMCATDTHRDLGKQFLQLSERCHQHINSTAEQTWMATL